MKKKYKKNFFLIATKAITINLFFKNFIKKNKNKVNFNLICKNPSQLIFNNKEIKKIKIDFPVNFMDFINPIKLLKLFIQLSKLKKKMKYSTLLLNTPIAAHFFRIYYFFSKLNITYFVHGFRFTENRNYFKNLLNKFLERVLSIPTRKYITINSLDYEYVIRKIKNKKYLKVNGVGINIKKKNEYNIHQKKFKILVISAYKTEKGYDDILYIAKYFNNKNYMISFICYGYGNYNKYQEFIIKNKLRNIFLKKFQKNLVRKIKNYTLMFHPSFREGLPVSVMQCLTNGLPVVARNIRGCNDLIINNSNGYLFNNKYEAIKYICYLYKNRKKLNSMSRMAFRSINYKYSHDFISRKIFSFVNE